MFGSTLHRVMEAPTREAFPAASNLRPAGAGNLVALKHGGHSERFVGPLAEEVLDEVEELCSDTPAAASQFAAARAVLARKLARLRLVSEYIEHQHGGSPLTLKGGILKSAVFEQTLLASVERSLADLGLTPTAAAKLGVDLVRGTTLAEELASARQVRVEADERMPAGD